MPPNPEKIFDSPPPTPVLFILLPSALTSLPACQPFPAICCFLPHPALVDLQDIVVSPILSDDGRLWLNMATPFGCCFVDCIFFAVANIRCHRCAPTVLGKSHCITLFLSSFSREGAPLGSAQNKCLATVDCSPTSQPYRPAAFGYRPTAIGCCRQSLPEHDQMYGHQLSLVMHGSVVATHTNTLLWGATSVCTGGLRTAMPPLSTWNLRQSSCLSCGGMSLSTLGTFVEPVCSLTWVGARWSGA